MEEVFYMTKNLIVRGAPQEYEIKENAWDSLPEHLYKRHIDNVLILHGKTSWKAVKDVFPDLSITKIFEYYGGECTDPLADSFVSLCKRRISMVLLQSAAGK